MASPPAKAMAKGLPISTPCRFTRSCPSEIREFHPTESYSLSSITFLFNKYVLRNLQLKMYILDANSLSLRHVIHLKCIFWQYRPPPFTVCTGLESCSLTRALRPQVCACAHFATGLPFTPVHAVHVVRTLKKTNIILRHKSSPKRQYTDASD